MMRRLAVLATACWIWGRWGAPHRTDRERLMAIYLDEVWPSFPPGKPVRLYDFAPAWPLSQKLKRYPSIAYRSADLSRRDTLYLAVPRTAPGLSVEGDWDPLGMRATVSRNLVFKDVFVPDDAALTPAQRQALDADLARRYLLEIPVVAVDGVETTYGPFDAAAVRAVRAALGL